MTLLNWEMTPDYVLILSDTLSLDWDDRRARSFTTKVYPVPHIGGVLTGTGLAPVVTQFFLDVNGNMVVTDVVHLAQFAPERLQQLWNEYKTRGLSEEATVTIYTFGLAEEGGQFTGYAYRSTNGFQAEKLQPGKAMKPGTNTSMEDLQTVDGLESFVALTRKQQAQDRDTPREKRVGIGGDLWMYLLGKSEQGKLTTRIERLERMEHYESDCDIMLAKLNPGHPRSQMILARDP